ncbi:hypothetical protein APLC1_2245 [Limnospira platensis C1]|nr:hypothetical protein APLC1_2245 [Arthrospira platensis C1]
MPKADYRKLFPQQVGSHQYKLKPPAPLPLWNITGNVTILPQGRAIVDPRRNWWKVCNATAIINAEGEMLPPFSRFYPTPLPGCRNHDPRRHPIFAKDGLTEAEAIAGTVAVVSGISGSVYFHWMVDVLPRLEILRQAGYNGRGRKESHLSQLPFKTVLDTFTSHGS